MSELEKLVSELDAVADEMTRSSNAGWRMLEEWAARIRAQADELRIRRDWRSDEEIMEEESRRDD